MTQRDRLLVVDGDPDDRALAAFLLASRLPRFHVLAIGDPLRLAEELEHDGIQAVICELELPWSDGLAVAEAVKGRQPACAFVVFTHAGREADVAAGIVRGVDGFAAKTSRGYLHLADTVQQAVARNAGGRGRIAVHPDLERLVETLAAGTFAAAVDGAIVAASPGAVRAFGAEREDDLIGRTLSALSTADDDAERLRACLARGEPFERTELRIAGSAGEPAWVRIAAVPILDTEAATWCWEGIVQDITQFRQAEATLASRARALAASNAELDAFASAVSHDLQEPLHLVQRYGEMLSERSGERLDDASRRHLEHLLDSSRRMQSMIDDLLELARVSTRGRDFVPVSLEDAVAEASARLRAAIEESGAEVDVAALPTVHADRTQMVQLFQNLIGNAIKFRGASAPRVRVLANAASNGWEITVADNGPGIPSEDHARVFDMFQRLHTTAEAPGTGMGLAICKRIVERHGGAIRVDSRPGAGAAFTFSLPSEPSQARATATAQGAMHG
jgi:PAS domain S-box-containing protein